MIVNSIWRSEELVKQVLEQNLQDMDLGGQEEQRSVLPEPAPPMQNIRKGYMSENQEKHKSAHQSEVKQQPRSTAKVTTTYSVHTDHQQTRTKNGQTRPQSGTANKNHKSSTKLNNQYEEDQINYGAKYGYSYSPTDQLRASQTQDLRGSGRARNAPAVEQVPKYSEERRNSRSFEKTQSGRPKSAHKEKSRDYGNTFGGNSQYSSVYSRILHSGEVNKIRKLVGEQNSDLDV